MLWGDDCDNRDYARKFLFENLVFAPSIQPVENNVVLTSVDEVFDFVDNAFDDKIFALALADLLSKYLLTLPSDFTEKGGSTREAKRVCHACEVRSECLKYALDNGEQFGIWGGLSRLERARLKRRAQVLPLYRSN